MAWIEVTAKRGRKEKHYWNPETGQFQAVLTIHDQHYKDENDHWQEVDESLVEDASIPGHSKKCDKTQHKIYLGNGGERRWYPRRNVDSEYVAITEIQYYTNQWRKLNLPAPVWNGNGGDWDLANLHATLTNTWKQIKTSFILKDNTAPTRLRFALTLVGLTLDSNTWEVKSGSTVVGSIPPPTFTDANSTEENPIFVPVTTTYAGGYIEWSINPVGFTYPLTSHSITFTDGYDGTVTTAKDTRLLSINSNENHGNDTLLSSGRYDGDTNVQRTLIEFNVSSISTDAIIDSATLYFYIGDADYSYSDTLIDMYDIAAANTDWVEGDGTPSGNSTWSMKVYNTDSWAGTAGLLTAGTDYVNTVLATFTIPTTHPVGTEFSASISTSAVGAWRTTNNGQLLKSRVETITNSGGHFCSSDHATTGYRPKLVVVYTVAYSTYWDTQFDSNQEVYCTLATVGTGTFRLWGRIVNPTGYGTNLRGYFAEYASGSLSAHRYNDTGDVDVTLGTAAVTLVDGDKLWLRLEDDQITVYVYQSGAWIEKIDVTDGSPALEGGYIGMYASSLTWAVDDFGGGDLSPGLTLTAGQFSDHITLDWS